MKMKVRLKSLLTISLALTMAASITACGGTASTSGTPQPAASPTAKEGTPSSTPKGTAGQIEKDAKLLVWDNGGSDEDWAKMVAAEFTKKYNVPVEVQVVSQGDAPTKLQTDGPAGLGADVFLAPHDKLGTLVASGLVLENFFPDEYKKDFMEAAITGTTMNKVLYGYPTAIDTYALFYNKDLVKQPPATMDELIAQAKAFTNKEKEKYGFMMEVGNLYFLYAFVSGYGGYVFGENNTNKADIGLNNEGAIKAGQLMQKLHKETLPLNKEDINFGLKETLFINNNLMFDINGPWAVAALQKGGVNFGVAPLPKLDNGKSPISFSGVRAYYVNSYSKYPEAASLYAKFATSEEMLMKKFEISGQMPPRNSLLENDKIKSNAIVKGFLDQAKLSVPMPNIPEMNSVWEPVGNAFTAIWNENADPKKALDASVKQVKEAMSLSQK
ncbi:extracellular solute-binding protein [Paenibacillus sp. SI8]|uniref:sugar ABC transporter substrate-binding protein n=1 Tax=unclassified Paenibacillus TaxID=185978 RepID=UPI003466CC83